MVKAIIAVVLFIAFLIVGNVIVASREQRRARLRAFDRVNEKATSRALKTSNLKTARESLRIMEAAREEASDIIPDSLKWGYQDDLELVRDRVADLEEAAWEAKADKYMQEFSDCWSQLVSAELESFRDVELFFEVKKACMRAWQKYYSIDISEFDTAIYPKQYFREWMGEDYDPCMESSVTLEKKLSEYAQRMRPEQKRKNALYKTLILYVADRGTIAQADLLKTSFPGYIEDEIKCCYSELVQQNRIVKTKLGNRWFVSLSDRELAENPPKKAVFVPESATASALRLLRRSGKDYYDKTPQGGALYFYDKEIAEKLKQSGAAVFYAPNGTKGNGNRPAWYVK